MKKNILIQSFRGIQKQYLIRNFCTYNKQQIQQELFSSNLESRLADKINDDLQNEPVNYYYRIKRLSSFLLEALAILGAFAVFVFIFNLKIDKKGNFLLKDKIVQKIAFLEQKNLQKNFAEYIQKNIDEDMIKILDKINKNKPNDVDIQIKEFYIINSDDLVFKYLPNKVLFISRVFQKEYFIDI